MRFNMNIQRIRAGKAFVTTYDGNQLVFVNRGVGVGLSACCHRENKLHLWMYIGMAFRLYEFAYATRAYVSLQRDGELAFDNPAIDMDSWADSIHLTMAGCRINC